MRINGTGFKVDTAPLSDTTGQAGTDPARELTEEAINDFFMHDETEGPGAPSTPSSNPIDDYTFGGYYNGSAVAPANEGFLGWLDNFPPTLEEVTTANENAINYLDIVLQKYEKGAEDVSKVIVQARATLENPTITAGEAANLNTVISKGEAALIRINHEITKTKELGIRQGNINISEKSTWKDLNNDGWIGKKGAKDSFIIAKDIQGRRVYLDSDGKLVANPILDPDLEPKVSDDGLRITDSPVNPPAAEDKTIDLYLQLTAGSLTGADNEFGTPIGITPPLAFWVEKNEDGGSDSYELDTEGPDLKMKIYDQWDDADGVKQKIPPNRQNYLQVKVAKMKVLNSLSGFKDDNGKELQNVEVEFYDKDGVLITRMRIEGFKGDFPAAAGLQDSSEKYVAASSVGFGIYDAKNIEVDASQYTSTGQHVVDNLASKLGITGPSSGRGREVFDKNMEPFKKDNGEGFGSYHDRYIPAGDPDKKATGIFIGGYSRGVIKGTRFNDVIKTVGVDEFSPYEQEHMPEDSPPMRETNGLYTNFVYADAGTNIVVSGKGNNYIFDSTLAWVKGGSNDKNFIATQAINRLREGGEREETLNNPATFVRVEGGTANIDNPSETDALAESRAADEANERIDRIEEDHRDDDPNYDVSNERADEIQEDELDDVEAAYKNDYYQISGGASVSFTNGTDPDIAGNYTPSTSHPALDRLGMETAALDRISKWQDEIMKIPEVDEAEIQDFIQKAGAAETELVNEMNGFFDAMFGDMNSFFNEQEVESAEGPEIAGEAGGGESGEGS